MGLLVLLNERADFIGTLWWCHGCITKHLVTLSFRTFTADTTGLKDVVNVA